MQNDQYTTSATYRLESAMIGLDRVETLMHDTGILNYKIQCDLYCLRSYLQSNIDYLKIKEEDHHDS